MCSNNVVLQSIHERKPGEEVGSILARYADEISGYAQSGDLEFFVSLGQLLEQV